MHPLAKIKTVEKTILSAASKRFKARVKRVLLSKTALPPSLAQIMEKRKGKPIRVVFVCEAGLLNSPMVKNDFEAFLERIHINPKKVFSLGFDSSSLENSKERLKRTDYFVFTLPGLLQQLSKTDPAQFARLKHSGAQLIFNDKLARVGHEGELEYFDLLKEIIARERVKR